ncbi:MULTISPECIES: hypothetical protein [unclassified Colwellia]|jgi:hypothetical protein|uniref:hypothetical protein n=1 Tax=unclassified Colwellia TaxID=196834 RepID=UPI0015F40936|nr:MULTISPECIES: hypothetical protein [unclassified Colwellia]MBA6256466.1 hypothetical protein [Colwellia sp. MB3u-28]MBA6260331.1 hypothetical protein [Colwellia sp. MB3u-41]
MSLRDIKKEKTAKRAREAIQRIINGIPTNKELKNRNKLKLNQSTVEKEAGLGVSALKHHGDILKEIDGINSPITETTLDTLDSNSNESEKVYLLNKKIETLKSQKKAAITAKKAAIDLNKEYSAEIEKLKYDNKALHSHHAQVVSAMFEIIPLDKLGQFVSKVNLGQNDNVIPIK